MGCLCSLQLLIPSTNEKKKQQKGQQNPIFMAEPMRASNSFVGTEEYIAPVCQHRIPIQILDPSICMLHESI